MEDRLYNSTTKNDIIDEDRQRGLNSIRKLGSQKPLGYLPIDTLESYFNSTSKDEIERAIKSGYKYLVLGPEDCMIGSDGALFVYDKEVLNGLLNKYAPTLNRLGWSTDPENFIRRVGKELVAEENEVYKIIANAFGNTEK